MRIQVKATELALEDARAELIREREARGLERTRCADITYRLGELYAPWAISLLGALGLGLTLGLILGLTA